MAQLKTIKLKIHEAINRIEPSEVELLLESGKVQTVLSTELSPIDQKYILELTRIHRDLRSKKKITTANLRQLNNLSDSITKKENYGEVQLTILDYQKRNALNRSKLFLLPEGWEHDRDSIPEKCPEEEDWDYPMQP